MRKNEKNDATNIQNEDPIRLVNNVFAFCFKEARLSTSVGSDIQHNIFCGQVFTIMKAITNEDGDLLSQFDNINENEIPILSRITDLPPKIRSTTHQKRMIDNHIDANKGKIEEYFVLGDIFGFCRSLKKLTKNLGFHLMLRTNNLQDNIDLSMGDDVNVTFYSL